MRKLRSAATTAVLLWLALPAPASASCAMPPPFAERLDQADAVFVGTVVELANLDRTATVEVEEIWKGAPLPRRVTVHGGEDDPNAMSSADRTYGLGRYLFAARVASGGVLRDDACSATAEWDEAFDEFRPAEVVELSDAGDPIDEGWPVPLTVAALALLVVAVISWTAFRRGRSPTA